MYRAERVNNTLWRVRTKAITAMWQEGLSSWLKFCWKTFVVSYSRYGTKCYQYLSILCTLINVQVMVHRLSVLIKFLIFLVKLNEYLKLLFTLHFKTMHVLEYLNKYLMHKTYKNDCQTIRAYKSIQGMRK